MAADINPTTALHNAAHEALLESLLADITMLRTAFNTAITKLNSDGGVSDSNYAAATTLVTTNA